MLTMISIEDRSHFLEGCLSKINEYRARHGSPELVLNPQISQISQKWSDYLAEKEGNVYSNPHSVHKFNGSKLGENISFGSISGVDAVDQFYSEQANYDYNVPIFAGNTGHFTQLVWKKSKEVGFGVAQCRRIGYIFVVNFYPSGNVMHKFQENVFPLQKGMPEKTPQVGSKKKREDIEHSKHSEFPNSGDLLHPKHGIQNLKFSEGDEEDKFSRRKRCPSPMFVREIYYEPGCKKTIERYISTGDESDHYLDFENRNAPAKYFADNKEEFKDSREKQEIYHQLAKSSDGKAVMFKFIDEVIECHNKCRRKHGSVPPLEYNSEISKIAQEWAEVLAHENTSLKVSGNKYEGHELGECLATKSSNKQVDYLDLDILKENSDIFDCPVFGEVFVKNPNCSKEKLVLGKGNELVEHWYDEKNSYNFNFPNEIAGIGKFGNFTQMVWKKSREIGVGKAWSYDRKQVFIVCYYFPAGNIIGHFKDNVYP